MRLLLCLLVWLSASLLRAEPVDYVRDIKPIFKERCYACHGALAQKGKLRLDSGKHILTGGSHGSAVLAKKPAESSLLERVKAKDETERMPPEGKPLTSEQIAKIEQWIADGAMYPDNDEAEQDPRDHWAFRVPVRPELPSNAATNPIDRFIVAEWQKRKLEPQKLAEKSILLRRVYLDLIGLPPTAEELKSFLQDDSPTAYEKVVDQLLASPHYGERWGRHFLDIWRYSDWWGLGAEVRNSQKHMWHYRDWAVESFNADKGYDQIIREQLAADELYPTDMNKIRATGYLARQYFRFNRNSWLDETVEHTSKAFLGLTWNCARCHDHKYDPIKQEEYYRFRAFFEPYQVRLEMVPGEPDFEKNGIPRAFDCNTETPTYLFTRGDEQQPVKDRKIEPGIPAFLSAKAVNIQSVSLPAESHSPQLRETILETHLKQAQPEGPAAAQAVRARFEADRIRATGTKDEAKAAAMRAAKAEKELAVAKAEKVLQDTEAALAKAVGVSRIGPGIKRNKAKAALEQSRMAVEKPGETYTSLRGALKTPESNLESEASRMKPFPTTSTGRRTALANWIASKENPLTARVAVNHVWLRHFGQPLVPNVFEFGRKGREPSHPQLLDWLAVEFMQNGWSFKKLHRAIVTSKVYQLGSTNLDREDSLKLDPENRYLWRQNSIRMDAPTVRDSLLHLSGELDRTLGGAAVPPTQQATSKRRSVYFFQSHNEHDKFLSIFDDANVLDCYRRSESIVPAQALALSNSKFAMTQAAKIASNIVAANDDEFIARAFSMMLGSVPTSEEKAACLEAMAEFRKLGAKRDRVLLVQTLLNHNDFVTIR